MKRNLPIIVGLVALVAAAFFYSSNLATNSGQSTSSSAGAVSSESLAATPLSSEQFGTASSIGEQAAQIDQDQVEPAQKVFASAADALAAIKKGAAEFDDVTLERFRLPGPDCTWCDSVYAELKELIKQPGLPGDTALYYAQILALSGKPENLQSLAELVTTTKDEDAKEKFAQAIEVAAGGPEVVTWLGSQLSTQDERLHEAVIAGLSNQNTRQAAELLYKQTVERDNPNEFYELGIGLGEFIPDEEALPYLQEIFLKRDKFSPLAVKALLNGGLAGVRIVAEALMNSTDTVGDKALLDGAVEHVILDDPTIEFLHTVPNNTKNQVLIDWANAALVSEVAGGDEEGMVLEEE